SRAAYSEPLRWYSHARKAPVIFLEERMNDADGGCFPCIVVAIEEPSVHQQTDAAVLRRFPLLHPGPELPHDGVLVVLPAQRQKALHVSRRQERKGPAGGTGSVLSSARQDVKRQH